ncbi:MAG: hypothetical protein QOG30_579 [Acidimicrobiaceae bacterium]
MAAAAAMISAPTIIDVLRPPIHADRAAVPGRANKRVALTR